MTLEEFAIQLANYITENIIDKKFSVIQEVMVDKIAKTEKGTRLPFILKGTPVGPLMYIDEMFNDFNNGKSMAEIAEIINNMLIDNYDTYKRMVKPALERIIADTVPIVTVTHKDYTTDFAEHPLTKEIPGTNLVMVLKNKLKGYENTDMYIALCEDDISKDKLEETWQIAINHTVSLGRICAQILDEKDNIPNALMAMDNAHFVDYFYCMQPTILTSMCELMKAKRIIISWDDPYIMSAFAVTDGSDTMRKSKMPYLLWIEGCRSAIPDARFMLFDSETIQFTEL